MRLEINKYITLLKTRMLNKNHTGKVPSRAASDENGKDLKMQKFNG